jgi:hypothetical protein
MNKAQQAARECLLKPLRTRLVTALSNPRGKLPLSERDVTGCIFRGCQTPMPKAKNFFCSLRARWHTGPHLAYPGHRRELAYREGFHSWLDGDAEARYHAGTETTPQASGARQA